MAAVLFAALSAHAQEVVELNGACDHKGLMNGVRFKNQGKTASGAPYFKAHQAEVYIYWDPNCGDKNDGTPKWIIDKDRPSTTAASNLDGSAECNFHAWVQNNDKSSPPARAMWWMLCDGDGAFHQVELTLDHVPQGDGPTSTFTRTTTTTVTTTRGHVPYALRLEGACHYQNFLNDLLWLQGGIAASGAPWYKAATTGDPYFLYFDPDCSGSGSGGQWIIDYQPIIPSRKRNLDGNANCGDLAVHRSESKLRPPIRASWLMRCETTRIYRTITFTDITTTSTMTTTSSTTSRTSSTTSGTSTTTTATMTGTKTTVTISSTKTSVTRTETATVTTETATTSVTATATTSTATTTTSGAHPRFRLETIYAPSDCHVQTLLGATFELVDTKHRGAPLYKTTDGAAYLYYEDKCQDEGDTVARWIIGHNVPKMHNMTLPENHGCSGIASTATGSAIERETPPFSGSDSQGVSWTTNCNNNTVEAMLILAVPTTTTARSTTTTKTAVTVPLPTTTEEVIASSRAATTTTAVSTRTATTTEGAVGGGGGTAAKPFVLSGACERQAEMNGVTFRPAGNAMNGAPIYKADGKDFYMYYDLDCNGDVEPSLKPMWILDITAPSRTSTADLDGDRLCNYLARVYSADTSQPPEAAKWWANCEGGFKEVSLSLGPPFHGVRDDKTCEASKREDITTTEDCAAAASFLRLHGRSHNASQMMAPEWGPKGCYWNSSSSTLMLASGTSQADSPAAGLTRLCKHRGRDTSAMLSSAVGYSWYAVLLPCSLAYLLGLSLASHAGTAA